MSYQLQFKIGDFFYDIAISINTKIDLEDSSYITEVSSINLGLGDFRSLSSNGIVVPEVLSLFFVQALNNIRPQYMLIPVSLEITKHRNNIGNVLLPH